MRESGYVMYAHGTAAATLNIVCRCRNTRLGACVSHHCVVLPGTVLVCHPLTYTRKRRRQVWRVPDSGESSILYIHTYANERLSQRI